MEEPMTWAPKVETALIKRGSKQLHFTHTLLLFTVIFIFLRIYFRVYDCFAGMCVGATFVQCPEVRRGLQIPTRNGVTVVSHHVGDGNLAQVILTAELSLQPIIFPF